MDDARHVYQQIKLLYPEYKLKSHIELVTTEGHLTVAASEQFPWTEFTVVAKEPGMALSHNLKVHCPRGTKFRICVKSDVPPPTGTNQLRKDHTRQGYDFVSVNLAQEGIRHPTRMIEMLVSAFALAKEGSLVLIWLPEQDHDWEDDDDDELVEATVMKSGSKLLRSQWGQRYCGMIPHE